MLLDFKIQNAATTQVGNDLNYNQLPEYQRHVALQIGDLKLSLGGEINGWLLCNGQSLSISEYRDLYNVIGTNFGSTGAGYFNVPDFTSRVIGMFGPSQTESELTIRTMGEAVGTETETLTTQQIPSHYHIGTTVVLEDIHIQVMQTEVQERSQILQQDLHMQIVWEQQYQQIFQMVK